MKALVDHRSIIMQLEEVAFPIAKPFKWVDVAEDCEVGWLYDADTQQAAPIVEEVVAKTYQELRKDAILEEWPVHRQLEAITEHYMGREELLSNLNSFILSVKEQFPKE